MLDWHDTSTMSRVRIERLRKLKLNVFAVVRLVRCNQLGGIDSFFGEGTQSVFQLTVAKSVGAGQDPTEFELQRSNIRARVNARESGVVSIEDTVISRGT